jgi:hypothetical protein
MSEGARMPGGNAAVPPHPELRYLPRGPDGYDEEKVEEAFEAFRRQIAALQAEIYELKTQGGGGAEPLPGDAARAETLRLVQAGTELAHAIEQDARETASRQLAAVEEEAAAARCELDERKAALEQERVQMLEAAEAQARAQLDEVERHAAEAISRADVRAEEIVEQARLEADELRAAAQEEVERRLEQATAVDRREEAAAVPVEEPAVEAASFRAPPLSPEDLASSGSVTFRVEPPAGP